MNTNRAETATVDDVVRIAQHHHRELLVLADRILAAAGRDRLPAHITTRARRCLRLTLHARDLSIATLTAAAMVEAGILTAAPDDPIWQRVVSRIYEISGLDAVTVH